VQATTGLRVTVRILDQMYQAERKDATDFKQNTTVVLDDYLPKWDYHAVLEFPCIRERIFHQFLKARGEYNAYERIARACEGGAR
jgi:hypothetical protein